MPFPVRKRTDLSLVELSQIDRQGGSVVKTPHIGNIYPNNLGVGHSGIPLLLYDRTIGAQDRNFHPHGVIRRGTFEPLSSPDVLTTHAKVQCTSSLAPEWFALGDRMLDSHMASLRRAMPQIQAQVYSDFLRAHIDDVIAILQVVTRVHPELWERAVLCDGTVVPFFCGGWDDLQRMEIFAVTSDDDGAIIPNVVNILLISVIEARKKGLCEVYHLSGPDMVGYMKNLCALLNELYDILRTKLQDWSMPENLLFNILQVVDMRFVVLPERRAALDELLDAYLVQEHNNARYGEWIRSADSRDRKRVVAEVDADRLVHMRRLIDAAHALPEIHYDIYQADATTQYDVLDAGGIYVHPWGIEAPLSRVSAAMRSIERFRQVSV